MRLIVGNRSFGPEDAVHRIDESGFVWAVATLGALIECYQKHHHVGIFGDVSLESIANNVPNLIAALQPSPLRIGGIHLDVPAGSKITIELPKDPS